MNIIKKFYTENPNHYFLTGKTKPTEPRTYRQFFSRFLKRNGLQKVKFHEIRHSCASLLLANGVPLKQIQDWLGHSDFSTTANIYAHLDYSSKLSSAQAMVSGMPLPEAGDFGSRWEQNAEKSGK